MSCLCDDESKYYNQSEFELQTLDFDEITLPPFSLSLKIIGLCQGNLNLMAIFLDELKELALTLEDEERPKL